MNHLLAGRGKNIISCTALAGLLAFSTSSQAADYDFSLGVQAGYNSSRSQFTNSSVNEKSVTEYPINGSVLGLYANAAVQMEDWSFGVEVDYTGREQSSRASIDNLLDGISSSKKLSFKNRQDASLLLGYRFSRQVRFYLRGGWSSATYNFSSFDSEIGTNDFELKLEAPHYGFGVHINLTEKLSLRTDYRFATFSGDRKSGIVTTDYEFDIHTFLIGLGYTF